MLSIVFKLQLVDINHKFDIWQRLKLNLSINTNHDYKNSNLYHLKHTFSLIMQTFRCFYCRKTLIERCRLVDFKFVFFPNCSKHRDFFVLFKSPFKNFVQSVLVKLPWVSLKVIAFESAEDMQLRLTHEVLTCWIEFA